MKIKKITAPTMPLAMERVKKELGPDAIIFHTKKVTKATFFNLFKKENVEVFAANDPFPFADQRDQPLKGSAVYPSKPSETKEPPRAVLPQKQPPVDFDELDYLKPASPIEKIQNLLKEQGVHAQYIDEWTRLLVKKWYQSGETMDFLELKNIITQHIQSQVTSVSSSQMLLPEEKIITVVGPTGVGKTTTLAKLAAKAVLEENQKVAFITIDTYRIAAIEQLKTYAGILNVPVEVVYTPEEFEKALITLKDMDRIFIDTAGRNYRDHRYVDELMTLLPFDEKMAVYLVMSATSKDEDMHSMMKQFDKVKINGLILTKVDETTTIGSLLNLLLKHPNQTVSYFTTGQDVPDDLEKASIKKLTDQLFRGDKND